MKILVTGVVLLWVVTLSFAASASENKDNPEQPDQKKATSTEVNKNPKDKPETTTDTLKTKADKKEVKAGEPKSIPKPAGNLKESKGSAKEDRPWIIKEHPAKKSDTPKKKPVPIKWENDAQRVQCETRLKELQKALSKARTYSIRGDTCATAKHSDRFLLLADRLKNECPEKFLESKGYSQKIIQNIKVLSELGKKACLDQ
jgi:type IV secretory pathway VirB10-like protein